MTKHRPVVFTEKRNVTKTVTIRPVTAVVVPERDLESFMRLHSFTQHAGEWMRSETRGRVFRIVSVKYKMHGYEVAYPTGYYGPTNRIAAVPSVGTFDDLSVLGLTQRDMEKLLCEA